MSTGLHHIDAVSAFKVPPPPILSLPRALRVLILDNFDSFTHNLAHAVNAIAGAPPLVLYNTAPRALIQSLLPYVDAVVISPGPGHPDVDADFGVCQLLLSAEAETSGTPVPILGVCLGLQGLATAYGARVVHAQAVMHGRRDTIHVDRTSVLFRGLPTPISAVRYNSLVVEPRSLESATALTVTARSSSGEIMGISHAKRRIHTVQFHPESVCTDAGTHIVHNFIQDVANNMAHTLPPVSINIPRELMSSPHSFCTPTHATKPLPRRTSTFSLKVLTRIWCDPESAFLALFARSPSSYWLDNSLDDVQRARYSYMGDATGPHSSWLTYDRHQRIVTHCSAKEQHSAHLADDATFFDYLQSELDAVEVSDIAPFDFIGGFVGYIAYEMRHECQPNIRHVSGAWTDKLSVSEERKVLEVNDAKDQRNPFERNNHMRDQHAAALTFADRFVVFDHLQRTVHLAALHDHSADSVQMCEEWMKATLSLLESVAAQPRPQPQPPSVSPLSPSAEFIWRHDELTYRRLIAQCKSYIRDGESYEICLTNELFTSAVVDPLLMYRHLRRINPTAHAAFIKVSQEMSIVCSSPEHFLKIDRSGAATCRPMKGTARRYADSAADTASLEALRSSRKEFSENLMIADLIRSDLSRAQCTVTVPSLMAVESYRTVHTLVTTVIGQTSNAPPTDLLRALFPPGSMTGAPKVRTCAIIDELECGTRGVYSGCIGYISCNGCLDMNVVIRTGIVTNSGVFIGAGGAIVDESEAEDEWNEIVLKSTAVQNAVRLAVVKH